MSEHDDYMETFFWVFEQMERQGPGSRETTLRVLDRIREDYAPARILEAGCGSGASALLLAEQTGAEVIAVDNHAPFIDRLRSTARERGLPKLEARCADMAELDYAAGSFDLLWSEGSAYTIGFTHALTIWQPLLAKGGWLFVSELVWLTDSPSADARRYIESEYPDIRSFDERTREVTELGYEVVERFALPRADWDAFYRDMEGTLDKLSTQVGEDHPTITDLRKEIASYHAFGEQYGYGCLLLRKP